ncbi:hypothetical protein M408DRAFT_330693 [Serendipita vermifera MAFF 305830]|uniref:Uncharacterized protein n=1 Tax=Serendipita vermifera MAFF 305830 TaxID=933852 RepID=A0A0C2WJ00_SERVB|nr:hypothetical protein M408DRAFT_330693 [Serendipita vermifera MAFF 305830]
MPKGRESRPLYVLTIRDWTGWPERGVQIKKARFRGITGGVRVEFCHKCFRLRSPPTGQGDIFMNPGYVLETLCFPHKDIPFVSGGFGKVDAGAACNTLGMPRR